MPEERNARKKKDVKNDYPAPAYDPPEQLISGIPIDGELIGRSVCGGKTFMKYEDKREKRG